MIRTPDWEARFGAALSAHGGRVGPYGHSDCALWGAGVVAAVWGVDWAADFKGAYRRRQDGLAMAGARTLEELLAARMGRLAPCDAKRGDLGLWRTIDRRRVIEGLCARDGALWVAPSRKGLVSLKRESVVAGWTLD